MNDTDYLIYQSTNKNTVGNLKMITREGLTPTVIDEGIDELISSLCSNDNVLFLPYVVEFDTMEIIDLYTLINSDPYKYMEFVYMGTSYYGYLIAVKSKPSFRSSTHFKLLLHPSSDITQLIR